ncbi:MAG: twin-arginine translocase subunit TatC [Planctomycetota bacterium]
MASRTPHPDSSSGPREGDPGAIMTFGEHLEELRRRLILALIVPLPVAVLAFVFADSIRKVMTAPLYAALEARRLPTQVQALSPVETLTTDLFLAVILSLVLSAPWLVFQLWKFVEPGLYANERRFAHFLMPASGVLVALGLSVLYWVMLPLMLLFLVGFGQPGPTETFPIGAAPDATTAPAVDPRLAAPPGKRLPDAETAPAAGSLPILDEPPASLRPGDAWIDAKTAQLRVVVPVGEDEVEIRSATLARDRSLLPVFRLREYVNFVLLLALAISIAFQLPLVILLLGWVGIVNVEVLRRNRKYAVLACAVVAAVLTPPDFISMFLLLGPLYGLYELGILLLVALPPERLARGSIVHDTFDRVRKWRRGGRDTAPSAATPPPPGAVPRGGDPFDEDEEDDEQEDDKKDDGDGPTGDDDGPRTPREPDGDADEDVGQGAGGAPSSEADEGGGGDNGRDGDGDGDRGGVPYDLAPDEDGPRNPGGASGGPPR